MTIYHTYTPLPCELCPSVRRWTAQAVTSYHDSVPKSSYQTATFGNTTHKLRNNINSSLMAMTPPHPSIPVPIGRYLFQLDFVGMAPSNPSWRITRRVLPLLILVTGVSTLLWGYAAETEWMEQIQSSVATLPSITSAGWGAKLVDESRATIQPVSANL